MATIHQTIKLVIEFYKPRLTFRERNFCKSMLDGLSWMGDVDDVQVEEYLTERQRKFARDIGRKFNITEKTRI